MHIYDMIIIGGGPAGYTAALYAAHTHVTSDMQKRAAEIVGDFISDFI